MSKVLIVEDEPLLQEVYELVLSAHGYEVAVAGNGIEGLNALKREDPEVILLDIFMPQMDGREFLKNFDRNEFPKTKIIVYTNLSDHKTKSEMLGLGADDFILKSSLTPKDLVALVDRLITS
jgi:two-component system OmpR family response regulator